MIRFVRIDQNGVSLAGTVQHSVAIGGCLLFFVDIDQLFLVGQFVSWKEVFVPFVPIREPAALLRLIKLIQLLIPRQLYVFDSLSEG